MPDPIVNTPPATTTPEATAPVTPTPDPVKKDLLSSILKLTKPEETVVTPPEPAAKPAEPEKPKEEPKPASAAKPKVKFTAKPAPAPTESVEDVVKRTVSAMAKPAAAPAPEPAAEDLSYLNEDEREELELAEFAEKKDPSKKGLAAQYKKFFKEQKEFLAKQAAEHGDDYDPATDPKFKQFIEKNEPKVSRAEKKKLFAQKISDEAREEGAREAEKRLAPKLKKIEDDTREIQERPKINERIKTYVSEVAQTMPKELIDYFEANGRDMNKLQEAFPEEYEIVTQHVNGARDLASEFLALRKGLKTFDVATPSHKFLNEFVTRQANALAASNSPLKIRDGKQFVLPSQIRPGMENTHWTLDDEDVLELLKMEAQNDAKKRIDAARARQEKIEKAKALRTAAPQGTAPVLPTPAEPVASPRTPQAPIAGAAVSTARTPGSLSSILNL